MLYKYGDVIEILFVLLYFKQPHCFTQENMAIFAWLDESSKR